MAIFEDNFDDEDKLVGQFYPICNMNKVSLQCLTPINIIVDDEKLWCNDKTLQFMDFPKTISIGGKTILSVAVPQHFLMKIAQMTNDFEIVSQFQPLNHSDTQLVEEIVSYFQVAETIHWSLFTMGLVLTL